MQALRNGGAKEKENSFSLTWAFSQFSTRSDLEEEEEVQKDIIQLSAKKNHVGRLYGEENHELFYHNKKGVL